jgi:hypothetical protein
MSRVRRQFQKHMRRYQRRIATTYCTLGKGDGTVSVPNVPNAVYVRENGRGVPFIVYNFKVQNAHGQPVVVGEDFESPGVRQVLGLRIIPGVTYLDGAGIQAHGASHTWGGADPIYIKSRQILDVMLYTSSGMVCNVRSGYVKKADGSLQFIANQTLDLTSHIPTTSGKNRWVCISVDTAGVLQVTNGSECDLLDFTFEDMPATPKAHVGIVYIKLRYGQSSLSDNYNSSDFVDARFAPAPRGITDHEDLDGLDEDDAHSQYLLVDDHTVQLHNDMRLDSDTVDGYHASELLTGGGSTSVPAALNVYLATTFR